MEPAEIVFDRMAVTLVAMGPEIERRFASLPKAARVKRW